MTVTAPASRSSAVALATAPATVALAAVSVVTACGFSRVFSGWDVVRDLIVLALVVHATSFGLRCTRLTAWVAVPLTYVVALVLIARAHHPGTLAGGWIPAPGTFTALRSDLEVVWREFPTALVPVPNIGPFAVISALTVGVVATTADLFAFRADGRIEALAPAAVAFVALSAVGADKNRIALAAVWLVTALIALALLRSLHDDQGTTRVGSFDAGVTLRRAGTAAGLACIATLGAVVIAPRLPGAGADALVDARRDGNEVTEVVSPLVDIRSRLVERTDRILFRVSSPVAAYWRLTSLARFDGTTWGLVDDDLDRAEGVIGTGQGARVDQTFEIAALGGNLAPAAFTPVEITGTELFVVADSATLVARGDGLSNGLRYGVTSMVPQPSVDQLRAATATAPPDPSYLELPDDFPAELRAVAADVTAGASTPFEQALALQDFFQQGFTYSLDVPSGHSEDAIVDFLERRSGYCEQFAGTFAAFARAIGLPARVAVGFTPGGRDLSGRYEVRGRNAHAWPEVWFDGIGWLGFEPTPGRGAPGAEAYTGLPARQDDGGGGGATPPSTPTTIPGSVPGSTVPSTGPATGPDERGDTQTVITAPGGGGPPVALFVLALLGGVALWALLMPPVVRWIVRRRRRGPADRVVGAWQASATALGLVGAPCRPSDTPMEHAARAARVTGFDPVTLRELAQGATAAVYGTTPIDAGAATRCERLRRYVVQNSREFTPWGTRVKARLDPRMAARLA